LEYYPATTAILQLMSAKSQSLQSSFCALLNRLTYLYANHRGQINLDLKQFEVIILHRKTEVAHTQALVDFLVVTE